MLTNTGTGAAWQAAGHAYGAFSNTYASPLSGDAFTPVASLTVPAGSYVVTFTTTISNFSSASSDRVICELASPEDLLIGLPESGFVRVGDPQEVITTQGLVANTRGGTITAQCLDSNNTSAAFAGETELIVNSVGAVTAPQPQPVPR